MKIHRSDVIIFSVTSGITDRGGEGDKPSYAYSFLVKTECVQLSFPHLGEEAVHRLLVQHHKRTIWKHSLTPFLFFNIFFSFSFDYLKKSWVLGRPVQLADFCIFITGVCIPSGLFFSASLDVGAKASVSY